jgi:hypothetical protein
MALRIKRTTDGGPPPSLEVGQLAVDLTVRPPHLYVGVPIDPEQVAAARRRALGNGNGHARRLTDDEMPPGVAWINPDEIELIVVGNTDGDEAPPGQVGEIMVGVGSTNVTVVTAGPAAFLNGQLDLTPGDWQIQGSVLMTHQGGGSSSSLTVGFVDHVDHGQVILDPMLANQDYISIWVGVLSAGQSVTIPIPVVRHLFNQPHSMRLGYFHSMNAGSSDVRVRMQALRVR